MRKNKSIADKIHNSKLFYKKDIIAYFLLALFIVFLVLFFILLPSSKQSNGFCVKKDGQVVLFFADNKVQIQTGYEGFVEQEVLDYSTIKVIVYSSLEKTGYNVILFDAINKTAKVIESTCSHSKDCCYSPAISNNGIIYCAPHGLSIEPIGSSNFTPPVTGGVK